MKTAFRGKVKQGLHSAQQRKGGCGGAPSEASTCMGACDVTQVLKEPRVLLINCLRPGDSVRPQPLQWFRETAAQKEAFSLDRACVGGGLLSRCPLGDVLALLEVVCYSVR